MQLSKAFFKSSHVFRGMFLIILLAGCLLSPIRVTAGKPAPEKPVNETERWLSQSQAYIKEDGLYLYAVRLFKAPVKRIGKITATEGENKFGIIQYFFTGGNQFRLETMPPEIQIAQLIVPTGFPNEKEAFEVLKKYDRATVNWSKPTETYEGNVREVEHSPDDYPNIFAKLKYKDGKLVELWYSMAL